MRKETRYFREKIGRKPVRADDKERMLASLSYSPHLIKTVGLMEDFVRWELFVAEFYRPFRGESHREKNITI